MLSNDHLIISDSKTLPWLAIPATQPRASTQGHPDTHHTVLTEGEKRVGVEGGKQKNKKSTNAENNQNCTLCSISV